IETVTKQLANAPGSENDRSGFNQNRLSFIVNSNRPETAPAFNDEIHDVRVFEYARAGSFNHCFLGCDDAICPTRLCIGRHRGEDLVLKLQTHLLKTLD